MPSEEEFTKMRKTLDEGKKVMYHMANMNSNNPFGHYAQLKGYIEIEIDGNKSYSYIFNDPGGNKYRGGYNRNSKN